MLIAMPNKDAEAKIYDVIVLGAGLSGLSAAHTLKKMGVDDLLVIEAKKQYMRFAEPWA